MPLTGWLCRYDPAGRVTILDCLKNCRNRCHPLPVIASWVNDRKPEPGVFHVTELFNPPQVTHLYRTVDYYVEPESNAYTAFGQAYHRQMELGDEKLAEYGISDTALKEGDMAFRVEIQTPAGVAILAGRPDRYEPDTKTLWDYKTEKVYSVKKLKAGDVGKHQWQLNTYRVYCPAVAGAERLRLSCALTDHGYQDKVRYGLMPVENIEVPLLEPELVREVVRAKLSMLLQIEQNPTLIPECAPEELWGGKRCEEYCAVSAVCPQYQSRKGSGAKCPSPRKKNSS